MQGARLARGEFHRLMDVADARAGAFLPVNASRTSAPIHVA